MFPNISFVKRKPKPLRTEFKTWVCAVLWANGHAEIQEGKDRMSRKRYNGRLGTTAGCVRRLLEAALRFSTKKTESPIDSDFQNGEINDERELTDFDDIDQAQDFARQ